MERLIVLGTGNAQAIHCYNTCYAMQKGEEYFLIDAGGGNGILSQLDKAGIPLESIHNIFVTHAHNDHILGMVWMIRMIATSMNKGTYDVFPYKPDIIIMQGGANDFLMSLYPGARVLAERLIRLARRIRQQLPDTKIYIESMYPAYTKRIGLMPSWAEGKSNKEIQKINTEIQRLCKQDNFEYVDVFDKLIGEDGQLSREYPLQLHC